MADKSTFTPGNENAFAGHFVLAGGPAFIGAQQAQQAPVGGHYLIAGGPAFIGAQQAQQGFAPGHYLIAGGPAFIGAQQAQQAAVTQMIPIGTPGSGTVNLNFFIGTSPTLQPQNAAYQPMPSTAGPTQTIDLTQTDIENQLEYLKQLREYVAQQLEQIEAQQIKLQQEKAQKKGKEENQY